MSGFQIVQPEVALDTANHGAINLAFNPVRSDFHTGHCLSKSVPGRSADAAGYRNRRGNIGASMSNSRETDGDAHDEQRRKTLLKGTSTISRSPHLVSSFRVGSTAQLWNS
jgi:hypothetical protein